MPLISGLYQSPLTAWKSIGHSLGSQKRTLKGTGRDSGPFPHGVFKKSCATTAMQQDVKICQTGIVIGWSQIPTSERASQVDVKWWTKPRRDRFPSSLASFVQYNMYNWKPIGSHSHSNAVMLAQVWQAHVLFLSRAKPWQPWPCRWRCPFTRCAMSLSIWTFSTRRRWVICEGCSLSDWVSTLPSGTWNWFLVPQSWTIPLRRWARTIWRQDAA